MRRWLSLAVAVCAALPLVALTAEAARRSAASCGKGKVARQIAGVRSCATSKPKRIGPAKLGGPAASLDRAIGGPVLLRRQDGKRFLPLLPNKMRRVLVAEVARIQTEVDNASAAVGRKVQQSREHATTTVSYIGATVTRNVREPSRVGERGFSSGGEVTTSIGGLSASTGFEISSADGKSVSQAVTFGAKDTTNNGKVGFGGTSRVRKIPWCPDGDGKIAVEKDTDFVLRGSVRTLLGLGTARKGAYTNTTTSQWRATAQMSPAAELQPFLFTVTVRYDEAFSESALVFQSIYRFYGTATMTGTMDPKSGQVSESSVTVNPKYTNNGRLSPSTAADVRAHVAEVLEATLRTEPPDLLRAVREVETRARAGRCTNIVLNPASPAKLQPSAKTSLKPQLRASGERSVAIVKWTATATKGALSPGSSVEVQPTFAITGAKDGPETASVQLKAVSPAGISEAAWTANGANTVSQWPAAYEGTLRSNLPTANDSFVTGAGVTWTANVRFERRPEQRGVDGNAADYTLVGGAAHGSVDNVVHLASGNCVTTGQVDLALPDRSLAATSPQSMIIWDARRSSFGAGFTLDPALPFYYGVFVAQFDGVGKLTGTKTGPAGCSGTNDYPIQLALVGVNTGWQSAGGSDVRNSASLTRLNGSRVPTGSNGGTTYTWDLHAAP